MMTKAKMVFPWLSLLVPPHLHLLLPHAAGDGDSEDDSHDNDDDGDDDGNEDEDGDGDVDDDKSKDGVPLAVTPRSASSPPPSLLFSITPLALFGKGFSPFYSNFQLARKTQLLILGTL